MNQNGLQFFELAIPTPSTMPLQPQQTGTHITLTIRPRDLDILTPARRPLPSDMG